MRARALVLGILVLALLASMALADTDVANSSFNVTVNELALLAITADVAGPLTLDDPVTGGDAPTPATDSSAYLRYTSIVPPKVGGGATTRTIQARVTTAVPQGAALDLTAAAPGGGAQGTVGASVGKITLGSTATDVLTGVGSCYTGTAAGDGSQLTYTFYVDDWLTIQVADTTAVTVEFTLSEGT